MSRTFAAVCLAAVSVLLHPYAIAADPPATSGPAGTPTTAPATPDKPFSQISLLVAGMGGLKLPTDATARAGMLGRANNAAKEKLVGRSVLLVAEVKESAATGEVVFQPIAAAYYALKITTTMSGRVAKTTKTPPPPGLFVFSGQVVECTFADTGTAARVELKIVLADIAPAKPFLSIPEMLTVIPAPDQPRNPAKMAEAEVGRLNALLEQQAVGQPLRLQGLTMSVRAIEGERYTAVLLAPFQTGGVRIRVKAYFPPGESPQFIKGQKLNVLGTISRAEFMLTDTGTELAVDLRGCRFP